jgi:hypothetical protein
LRIGYSTLIPATGVTQTAEGSTFRFDGMLGVVPAALAVVGLIVLLLALGWGSRRRDLEAVSAACWVAAGGVLATPACLALISVGDVGFAQHHVRWMWSFGVFVGIVVLWAAVELIAARWPGTAMARVRQLAPAGLAVAAALSAVPYLAQQQGPVADYEAMPALRRVFQELEPLKAAEPVFYDTANVRVYEPYSSAVMMRLQELGIEFRVKDEGMVRQLGERRRSDGSEPTTIFQLEGADAMGYDGPACTLALASAFSPEEERELGSSRDAIVAAVVNGDLQLGGAPLDVAGAGRQ